MIYEAREDSELLKGVVLEHATGSVLDVGCGSGVQSLAAASLDSVTSVVGVDIQKEAVDYCKKNSANSKITYKQSDMFATVSGQFDTIVCNPPYLPDEEHDSDPALYGGPKGYEWIERFISEVSGYLKANGQILLLFSSLSHKDVVEKIIVDRLFSFIEISKTHIFHEDLFVYKIVKTDLLKELETKNYSTLCFFAKGKRGLIYVGVKDKNKYAIKTKNPSSQAIERIENEINTLKITNKEKIGPQLVDCSQTWFSYEFIEGISLEAFLENTQNTKEIIEILRNVLDQCFELDQSLITKKEMSHPQRNILISGKKPVLIDFERAKKDPNPSNVSQFVDFILSTYVQDKLGNQHDSTEIIESVKEYKKNQTKENYNKLKKLLFD